MEPKYYLTKADIKRTLGISQAKANRVYALAEQIDERELPYRIEFNKVRLTSALKVYGISQKQFERQLKALSPPTECHSKKDC